MSIVWVVKAAGHDFSAAREYGEIRHILPEDVSPFNVDMVRSIIKEAMKTVKEGDYVIPSGPPLVNMILMDEWPLEIMRCLLFHARTHTYVVRDLCLTIS